MKRFKSIDLLRGLSMVWMIYGHIMDWWLEPSSYWFYHCIRAMGDVFGSGSFIFLSGISTMISYRRRNERALSSGGSDFSQVRTEYLFRAFFFLLVAFGYNFIVSIMAMNFFLIWNWFVLQTVAFSLFLAWPLLKSSKLVRIILGALIMIGNQILLAFLLPYEGEANILGVLFHIFYTNIKLDPIFSFFPFFLIGTVLGDLVHDLSKIEHSEEQMTLVRKQLLFPSLILGTILYLTGIVYLFPTFIHHRTFPWLIYDLGFILIVSSMFISLDFLGALDRKKSYKSLFYFSYYSISAYLAHNLLFFVFTQKLNWILLTPAAFITIILVGVLLRALYKSKYREDVSLKVQIGKIALYLTKKIENRKLSL
ncbi:MAG: DUF1624 domain-containing protein [Candidatus Lokiarchaeota archaeon]|nr:DUF1624 domain-containing protein [Candidatus Lokiarchaeota archaeon]